MVDEDRPDEVVLPLVLLVQSSSLLLSILDKALNEVSTALTDDWGDGTVILHHHSAVSCTLNTELYINSPVRLQATQNC